MRTGLKPLNNFPEAVLRQGENGLSTGIGGSGGTGRQATTLHHCG